MYQYDSQQERDLNCYLQQEDAMQQQWELAQEACEMDSANRYHNDALETVCTNDGLSIDSLRALEYRGYTTYTARRILGRKKMAIAEDDNFELYAEDY